MEKICIVKRRKKELFIEPERSGEGDSGLEVCLPPEMEFQEDESQETAKVVSIDLTPEQSRAICSCSELAPGKTCMVDLETEETDGGRVVFNFRLAPLYGGRMLDSWDVCSMLRISRGSLRKLVRTNKMDSYRVGRLRRFLLEDVLHYLSRSRELPQSNTQTGASSTSAGIH